MQSAVSQEFSLRGSSGFQSVCIAPAVWSPYQLPLDIMAAENAGTDLSLATQSFAPFAVVPHCELETCQPMTSPEGFRDTVAISSSSLAATSATHGSGTAAAVPTTTTAAGSEALTFRSESERRQFGNKLSQRRFRERRKVVVCGCPSFHGLFANNEPTTSILLTGAHRDVGSCSFTKCC